MPTVANCCCVAGCLNSYSNAPEGTSWHPFPKNKNVAKEWRVRLCKNDKETKNALVCSHHFRDKDFKNSSHNTRSKRRILSLSAVPSIDQKIIKKKNNKNVRKHRKAKVNILDIPLDIWEQIFDYVSPNDVISLSSVCQHLQRNVRTIKHSLDLSNYYPLNTRGLLNTTLSTSCTRINLNNCYWLQPSVIKEIISKTNLTYLHIIECQVNEEVIEAILGLNLTSLSLTYDPVWRAFFENSRHANSPIPGFEDLNSLQIVYKKLWSEVLLEIYLNVLPHCEQLQHLKVSECSRSPTASYFDGASSQSAYLNILPTPTPVPQLKSLVIKVKELKEDKNVAKFLTLILNNKVTPVQIDFGSQSGYLYKKGILSDFPITLDRSTLSIDCLGTKLNYWMTFPSFQNQLNQVNYKAVTVKNVALDGFDTFAQIIVRNSANSLKEVHINPRMPLQKGNFEFLDGLSHIALNCSQITVFDVPDYHLEYNSSKPYLDNVIHRKHKAFLNTLSNLKNLQVLIMSPTILHCKYYNSKGEKCEKAMPFWKVTSACKKLIEIRIVLSNYQWMNYSNVHEDSLHDIALCAKLRVLHLVRFSIQSSNTTYCDISKITRVCRQLQKLYVRGLRNFSDKSYIFSNTNIKIISISGAIYCNQGFLGQLSRCKKLEKFYVDNMLINEDQIVPFAKVLRKLKNLTAFIITRRVDYSSSRKCTEKKLIKIPSNDWRLDLLLKSIVNERPAFFYCLGYFGNVFGAPSAHRDSWFH